MQSVCECYGLLLVSGWPYSFEKKYEDIPVVALPLIVRKYFLQIVIIIFISFFTMFLLIITALILKRLISFKRQEDS